MYFRNPLSSLTARLARQSSPSCRRDLHRARPAPFNPPHIPIAQRAAPSFSFPRHPRQQLSTTCVWRDKAQEQAATPSSSSASTPTSERPQSKYYSYEDVVALTESPDPKRILIDVREPSELDATGRIPTALHIPLKTSPDFAFVQAAEFEARFGFARPSDEHEVVFYCKAGVRSRAAAALARQGGFGGRVGEFEGSWDEWKRRGGRVEGEREGEGKREGE